LRAKRHFPAHAISIDRERCTIVVSIRGTFSVFDAITDIDAAYTRVTVQGVTGNVHSGIYQGAINVLENIRETLVEV
jgi:hypothetical protein